MISKQSKHGRVVLLSGPHGWVLVRVSVRNNLRIKAHRLDGDHAAEMRLVGNAAGLMQAALRQTTGKPDARYLIESIALSDDYTKEAARPSAVAPESESELRAAWGDR